MHGGPGGSTSTANTTWFDPAIYRVILYDQRGSGKSTPSAEIRENTSQHLVADIEVLRKRLGIEQWHLVFGGSWGSTLALMYAQAHPAVVGSLIVRGIHLGRKADLDFHRKATGSAMMFPEQFESFLSVLPIEDRDDPVRGYLKLLQSVDAARKRVVAREYNAWDLITNQLEAPPELWKRLDNDKWCIEHALIECHYFANGDFIEEGELLWPQNIDKIRHIPGEQLAS